MYLLNYCLTKKEEIEGYEDVGSGGSGRNGLRNDNTASNMKINKVKKQQQQYPILYSTATEMITNKERKRKKIKTLTFLLSQQTEFLGKREKNARKNHMMCAYPKYIQLAFAQTKHKHTHFYFQ